MEVARDSRSTVNCDSSILRLPNEILLLIFDAVKFHSTSYIFPSTSAAPHRLAAVCRRFRDILVRDLYRVVSLPKYSYPPLARSALISLLPSYGHYVHHLEASAGGGRRSPTDDDAQVSNQVLSSLSLSAKHFTHLRYLQLHLYGLDSPLTPGQEANLIEMFKVMPPHLQELDLAGFSWNSAAKALAVAQQPNLQRLLLNLESKPGARMATAKLTAYFPALVHIHIPAHWCPKPSWFMQAFEGSKLEHIAVGFTDDASSAEPDDHLCDSIGLCLWTVGLDHLFAASSSSLTTMTISTASFPSGSFVSFIKHVTTVTFRNLDFQWDDDVLDELVGPFTTLSITALRFVDCSGIPPEIGRWFEDTEPSRQFFPALKELKAGQLYTQGGREDFDEWDPDGDIIPEGDLVWQPEERRKFEKDCERRGINAVFEWEY